jgi:hypothetical protein
MLHIIKFKYSNKVKKKKIFIKYVKIWIKYNLMNWNKLIKVFNFN